MIGGGRVNVATDVRVNPRHVMPRAVVVLQVCVKERLTQGRELKSSNRRQRSDRSQQTAPLLVAPVAASSAGGASNLKDF
jgi:hypothetical protein